MTQTKIQPSFAAGEVSPSLWGRVDFAKLHTGASTLRNFYVDYRGGASSRAGTQFCGKSLLSVMPGGSDYYPNVLEARIRAMTLLPTCGEFAYETTIVSNGTTDENSHGGSGIADMTRALDSLQAQAPNLKTISLPVAWFGSDLRCAHCVIEPKVDSLTKTTTPLSWSVGSVTRTTATLVSSYSGAAAYGGTPSDHSVTSAIAELKRRGLGIIFEPFLLMDVPNGNTLPDPWQAGGPLGQGAYPWRGRVTVDPAPGVAGSVDQSVTAASQIATFVSQYRAFILHYADLCASAGGVDAFVIGTEMPGLTWVRSDGTSSPAFPFVDALVALAADVKAMLPAATITYAADWSEFTPYQTSRFGGTGGEIFHHLDPLWASASIDAIGVDAYYPLSDWRSGTSHADYTAGWRSIYDQYYLQAGVEGGEGYDWYYGDRTAQTRTAISDWYGEDYIWRFKDLRNWWLSSHRDRPGAVRNVAPTAWTPQSKPIWFLEMGCPAVDNGSNQPNVFVDPKSSESSTPYFSTGARDDKIQRAYNQAMLIYWQSTRNPVSTVYGGTMIDVDRMVVYCWDARPYPDFPTNTAVWADAANWQYGHWLSGRLTLSVDASQTASGQGLRLIPFIFSAVGDQARVLEFTDHRMRVLANGAFVTEPTKVIATATNASPVILGVTSHGFSDGDQVYVSNMAGMTELNSGTFTVTSATASSFSLLDMWGNAISSTGFGTYTASSGQVARLYALQTPYAAADLPLLKYAQDKSVMTLTHANYAQRDLTRLADDNWTLVSTAFFTAISPPSDVYASPSSAGNAAFSYCVTAIDAVTGQESVASSAVVVSSAVDISTTAGSIMISWPAVSGVAGYNIYKAPPSYAERVPIGSRFGWIGYTVGLGFIDRNIVPDYTTTPPIHNNPFAQSTITYVDVLTPGSGYHQDTTTASASAPNGSGAVLIPIIDSAAANNYGGGGPGATGGCQGIIVVNGGEGYASGAGTTSTAGATNVVGGAGGNGCGGFGGGASPSGNATTGSGGGGAGGTYLSQNGGAGAIDNTVYGDGVHGPLGGGGGAASPSFYAPAGTPNFPSGGGCLGYPSSLGANGASGFIAISYTSTVTGLLVRVFHTSGAGSSTVPADCTSAKIECYGGFGGAGLGGGGGGPEYARDNALALTPGATYYYSVGAGGTGGFYVGLAPTPTLGGDTWFNKAANSAPAVSTNGVLAFGGGAGDVVTGGAGGTGGVGDVTYAGGAGGASTEYGGGGGGGSGGPNGTGKNGGACTTAAWGAGGGGGGGSNGATSTVITLTDTNGTPGAGATFTAHVGPATGTWPSVCAYFQQRRVYANSTQNPDTYWMSKPGSSTNFDYADPTNDGDSIEGSPWAQQVNGVNWMIPMPGGLVLLTGRGAWQLNGSGTKGSAVTPSSQNAEPQAYYGCSNLTQPIAINRDILYTDNNVVYDLKYDLYAQIYTGEDITILSTHLLDGRTVKQWGWVNKPNKLIWMVLDNGALLSLTYLKEQEVIGWARHDTAGLFADVCVIPENGMDRAYFAVTRYINGQWITYVERMNDRRWNTVEECWAVDAGLRYPMVAPDATLIASAASGAGAAFTASASVFDATNVGAVLRMGGGVATVTAYVSATQVTATITTPIKRVIPNRSGTPRPLPAHSGEWTLTQPVSSVSGLWHLEGETVAVLADGVPATATVTNGAIALASPASAIVAGLGYQCQMQSLYLDVEGAPTVQGKRKNLYNATIRIARSRGVKVSSNEPDQSLQTQQEPQTWSGARLIKDLNVQTYNDPTVGMSANLFTGDLITNVKPNWRKTGQIAIQQDYPLPCTITAIMPEFDVGDSNG